MVPGTHARIVADALTAAVAVGAGLASFLSPCVLPVVPGILAVVAGDAETDRRQRLATTGAFVAGFGAAFVVAGLLIGAAGTLAIAHGLTPWIERIGGATIIVFGLHTIGLLELPGLGRRVGGPDASDADGSLGAAVGLGAAFGVGWSPCVGPMLASILVLAGTQGGLVDGALLLAAYAGGLGVPFLALGWTADRGTAFVERHARAARAFEVVGGVVLIVLGIFVFTGSLARLTSYVI